MLPSQRHRTPHRHLLITTFGRVNFVAVFMGRFRQRVAVLPVMGNYTQLCAVTKRSDGSLLLLRADSLF